MNSIEFALLLQSHSEERARQLLEERYSLSGSQKPFLVLHDGANDKDKTTLQLKKRRKSPAKSASKHQQRKSAACRQLEIFRKTGDRNYKTYEPLNSLWNDYITQVLGKSTGVPAAQLILSSDWSGAKMKTVSCRNPSCLMITGIILWESKSQWLIATPTSGLKMLSKRGTVIELIHPSQAFEIIGDRVEYRSSERTTRKFKPHTVSDIASLLSGHLEKRR